MTTIEPTRRTRVGRLPERASYDRGVIHAILDEGLVCHLGIGTPEGPIVLPTTYARVGDIVYVHGSPAAGLLRRLRAGDPLCLSVTHLDGLVLARSTFHHSMNYRSVVLLGIPRIVTDPEEKTAALDAIVEHIVPGRTNDARPGNTMEVAGTLVLALTIDEGSAKIRTGDPTDDGEDLDLPVWAGVIPLRLTAGIPVPSADLDPAIPLPAYLATAAHQPPA